MKNIADLIDRYIREADGRTVYTKAEVTDMLLELRLCTMIDLAVPETTT